jgi:serine/threonine protein kinase
VKCRFKNELRVVAVTKSTGFRYLQSRLESDYGFDLSLKYQDSDGDYITLASQNDLNELIELESGTVTVIVVPVADGGATLARVLLSPTPTASGTQLPTLKRDMRSPHFTPQSAGDRTDGHEGANNSSGSQHTVMELHLSNKSDDSLSSSQSTVPAQKISKGPHRQLDPLALDKSSNSHMQSIATQQQQASENLKMAMGGSPFSSAYNSGSTISSNGGGGGNATPYGTGGTLASVGSGGKLDRMSPRSGDPHAHTAPAHRTSEPTIQTSADGTLWHGNTIGHGGQSRQTHPYNAEQINRQPFRWQRGEVLGQGAFGTVYLGFDLQKGTLMAVKNLDCHEVSTRELAALENEILLMQNLRHENIVRYLGTERTKDSLSIFLEYVPGGSVRSVLDRFGMLEEGVVRVYSRQLLLGLEYLHNNGIAHRDIKGANVLVSTDGTIKVADFGGAKRITQRSSVALNVSESNFGGVKGTPLWMAPEVIKEQQAATGWKKADIWSVGCTVIEMATGKPPWSQFSNPVTAMYHIACVEELPQMPENLSPEGKLFLSLCIQRDPSGRPDVSSLLLQSFVAHLPNQMLSGSGSQRQFNRSDNFYPVRPCTADVSAPERERDARMASSFGAIFPMQNHPSGGGGLVPAPIPVSVVAAVSTSPPPTGVVTRESDGRELTSNQVQAMGALNQVVMVEAGSSLHFGSSGGGVVENMGNAEIMSISGGSSVANSARGGQSTRRPPMSNRSPDQPFDIEAVTMDAQSDDIYFFDDKVSIGAGHLNTNNIDPLAATACDGGVRSSNNNGVDHHSPMAVSSESKGNQHQKPLIPPLAIGIVHQRNHPDPGQDNNGGGAGAVSYRSARSATSDGIGSIGSSRGSTARGGGETFHKFDLWEKVSARMSEQNTARSSAATSARLDNPMPHGLSLQEQDGGGRGGSTSPSPIPIGGASSKVTLASTKGPVTGPPKMAGGDKTTPTNKLQSPLPLARKDGTPVLSEGTGKMVVGSDAGKVDGSDATKLVRQSSFQRFRAQEDKSDSNSADMVHQGQLGDDGSGDIGSSVREFKASTSTASASKLGKPARGVKKSATLKPFDSPKVDVEEKALRSHSFTPRSSGHAKQSKMERGRDREKGGSNNGSSAGGSGLDQDTANSRGRSNNGGSGGSSADQGGVNSRGRRRVHRSNKDSGTTGENGRGGNGGDGSTNVNREHGEHGHKQHGTNGGNHGGDRRSGRKDSGRKDSSGRQASLPANISHGKMKNKQHRKMKERRFDHRNNLTSDDGDDAVGSGGHSGQLSSSSAHTPYVRRGGRNRTSKGGAMSTAEAALLDDDGDSSADDGDSHHQHAGGSVGGGSNYNSDYSSEEQTKLLVSEHPTSRRRTSSQTSELAHHNKSDVPTFKFSAPARPIAGKVVPNPVPNLHPNETSYSLDVEHLHPDHESSSARSGAIDLSMSRTTSENLSIPRNLQLVASLLEDGATLSDSGTFSNTHGHSGQHNLKRVRRSRSRGRHKSKKGLQLQQQPGMAPPTGQMERVGSSTNMHGMGGADRKSFGRPIVPAPLSPQAQLHGFDRSLMRYRKDLLERGNELKKELVEGSGASVGDALGRGMGIDALVQKEETLHSNAIQTIAQSAASSAVTAATLSIALTTPTMEETLGQSQGRASKTPSTLEGLRDTPGKRGDPTSKVQHLWKTSPYSNSVGPRQFQYKAADGRSSKGGEVGNGSDYESGEREIGCGIGGGGGVAPVSSTNSRPNHNGPSPKPDASNTGGNGMDSIPVPMNSVGGKTKRKHSRPKLQDKDSSASPLLPDTSNAPGSNERLPYPTVSSSSTFSVVGGNGSSTPNVLHRKALGSHAEQTSGDAPTLTSQSLPAAPGAVSPGSPNNVHDFGNPAAVERNANDHRDTKERSGSSLSRNTSASPAPSAGNETTGSSARHRLNRMATAPVGQSERQGSFSRDLKVDIPVPALPRSAKSSPTPLDDGGVESKQSVAADKIKQWFHKYSPKRPPTFVEGAGRPGHLKLRMKSSSTSSLPISCKNNATDVSLVKGEPSVTSGKRELNGRSHRHVVEKGTASGSERKRQNPAEGVPYDEEFTVFQGTSKVDGIVIG